MTENVFEKAIEVLQEYGYVKNKYGSDAEGYCALGALHRAYHPSCNKSGMACAVGFSEKWVALAKQLAAVLGYTADFHYTNAFHIAEYNDRPTTSVEDIILMFKKAAHDA
jgi:hypothetical protein